MPPTCKGQCDRLNKTKDFHQPYRKHCKTCDYYLVTHNVWCFCCHGKLGIAKKSRPAKIKELYRSHTRIE